MNGGFFTGITMTRRRRARRRSRTDKSPAPPVVPIVFWGKRICQGREMNTLMALLPSLEPDEGSATMSKVKTRPHYRPFQGIVLLGKDPGFDFGKKSEHLSGKLFVLSNVMLENIEPFDLVQLDRFEMLSRLIVAQVERLKA